MVGLDLKEKEIIIVRNNRVCLTVSLVLTTMY